MSPRARKPLPQWKRLIMTQEYWPQDLIGPQTIRTPAGRASVCSGVDLSEYWAWEILRSKDGRSYYLKAWLDDDPNAYKDATPAVRLTPPEAMKFLLRHFVPPIVAEDVQRFRARTGKRRHSCEEP